MAVLSPSRIGRLVRSRSVMATNMATCPSPSRLGRSRGVGRRAVETIHPDGGRAQGGGHVQPGREGRPDGLARERGGASGAALAFPRTVRGSPPGMADGGPCVVPFQPVVRRRRSACASIGIPGSVLLALLFLFPAADAYAQPRIGRLFSTQEQRIELDRLRDDPDFRTEAESAAERTGSESRPAPASGPLALPVTVNGVVLRSDGHRLAWVNGVETAAGSTTSAGVRIDAEPAPGGWLRIRWPGGRTSAALKPGQTIDAEGRVRDVHERRATNRAPGNPGDRAADSDAGEAGDDAAASPGAAEPASPPALPARLVRELLWRMQAGSAPADPIASDVPPAGGG